MPRTPAPVRMFTHPLHALATVALTALALTGCGSEEPSGSGAEGEPARVSGSRASATPPTSEQAAFATMLDQVARPCSSAKDNTSEPTGKKPTGPWGTQSLPPGETPPAEPIEPGAPTGPETELNDRDRCASVQHEQRIIEALQTISEPTPAKVREALTGLGYIDERIHGLKQDGRATHFHLDLREKGGRLCEAGLAAGEETDVTVCPAPATGAFTAEQGEPG